MLHTTFAKVKKANACIESYRKFAKFKGGITKWGRDKPFPLSEVLEVCGLNDTIWCFRCTVEPSGNTVIEFACRCALHVLHFYEEKYPYDKRPYRAIETARAYLTDKSEAAAWTARAAAEAAAEAARAAAEAAAWTARAAAEAAAWTAAWAAAEAARAAAEAAAEAAAWAAAEAARAAQTAEQNWQTKTLLALLGEN